jgi:LAGLIDADG endonuclease
LFEQCYKLIKQKEHLTHAGFEQILALKYNLNKGLPDDLKSAFPKIVPVVRPEYKFNGIPDPFLVSGFISGYSTFSVSIENSTNKLGKRVRLIFGTCLHIRDKELLIGMADYFKNLNFNLPYLIKFNLLNCSKEISVHCSESNNTSLLQIKNNFDIENKVIPFFNQYPILGVKRLDFEDFKIVAELIKTKEHLNAEGLNKNKIIKIVEGMNLDRKL